MLYIIKRNFMIRYKLFFIFFKVYCIIIEMSKFLQLCIICCLIAIEIYAKRELNKEIMSRTKRKLPKILLVFKIQNTNFIIK